MWMALLLAACSGDDEPTPTPTADTATTTAPQLVQDVFIQTIVTPLDILWVVDGTWTDGLTALDEALDDGMETLLLADPNWRMGVLAADTSSNQTRGVIRSVFESWPLPPTQDPFSVSSAGPPRVREAIWTAFEERLEKNEEFLRPEADLYVLVYTDREDQTVDDVISELDFVEWFEALELSQDKRIGVLTTSDTGPAWRQITNTTGGTVFEAGGFKRGLETLLLDAMRQEKEFRLSRIPAAPPEEVIVVVRERGTVYEIDDDYTYLPDSNKIAFDRYVPPPGAQIRIEYYEYVEGQEPTEPTEPTTTGSE